MWLNHSDDQTPKDVEELEKLTPNQDLQIAQTSTTLEKGSPVNALSKGLSSQNMNNNFSMDNMKREVSDNISSMNKVLE